MASSKEYDFIVSLKRADYRPLNIISVLMCVLAVSVSVFGLIYTGSSANSFYLALLLNCFIVIFLIYSFFTRKKDVAIVFRWALTASAILWFLPPQNKLLIALLYIVASFIERQLKQPQEVGFDKEEIVINSFPSKKYSWQEINNVILKDNMLTIDSKNNKILQKETDSDVSCETEKEFNAFCLERLQYSDAHL